MSEDDMYTVEKILDRKRTKNKLMYKIKWDGYPMSQCTWEPLENLATVLELVEDYDKIHPLKQNKKNNIKNNFLEQKKELPKKEKQEILQVIEKNPEGAQEEEKVEKINNTEEEQQQYTIIPTSELCKKYKIDDSMKKVITVRKKNDKLVAAVEKMKENGDIVQMEIETNKLKTDNPWILLDFYESKIKFA